MSTQNNKLEMAAKVAKLLAKEQPTHKPVPRFEPVDELIYTVLTQHTSDLNAMKAFKSLKSRYPYWENVLNVNVEDLKKVIKSSGLSNQKAPRIISMLGEIKEYNGSISLDFLSSMPPEEARAWLMELTGVGIKSASVVLAFSFGMPLLPVDTHVYRVAKRLSLLATNCSVKDAHYELEKIVPNDSRFLFHMLLITHGRNICKAIKPRCHKCSLQNFCPSSTVTSS